MYFPKHLFGAATLALAAALPSVAAAQSIVVLEEQFNDITSLTSWARINNSVPRGRLWFQGNPGIFAAHSGAPDSYIAANFLSAENGTGAIDNWLISPELTFLGPSTLSFFARGEATPNFNDILEVRFSMGADTAPANFATLLTTVGGVTSFPTTWQEFSASFDYAGTGRFAFRYLGDAAAANYVGLDSVFVTTVPEADTYLMLIIGLGAVAFLRRREHKSNPLFGENHA
ncbi:MAG: choice-of-anchor J domain-containing protein [Pseudomonadota bacterium]